jgi:hypothetical protein
MPHAPTARRRFITIHGHFYQPPRENPWLEAVETQDSAHPYHDWNERITAECYAPNAASRIMDSRDRILQIVNNYASSSFNFGPTLLSWMQNAAPDTYQAILDADRASRRRFSGHGNAIAQVYNHVILPLANARDKRTQIHWGIRDFESRFNRKPEAMWLPETAVDTESLEALVAEDIKFTILEPHQVTRFRRIGETKWESAEGIDPTRAYRCNLPSGSHIDLFLYDGPISRAVAFENLLARGEFLALRLVGAFSESRDHPQLVNIATDGETYGHHHRFGEMALAYAIHYIDKQRLARITNYGMFLEQHPPEYEVEIAERTAWSCVHGVERWRSDCGCSTGGGQGWNQRWRTPLREALDWLRDECAEIFEAAGKELLPDPWEARDDYIGVVLDRSDAALDTFLARHGGQAILPVQSDESAGTGRGAGTGRDARTGGIACPPSRVLALMEMQRNAMLMYTSCGWFFNDVSGIETVQVLHYAARVVQLALQISGRDLEPGLMDRLSPAQSNLPDKGTARDLYVREVIPTRLDLSRVAAHYAVASLFDNFAQEGRVYCYRVVQNDFVTDRAGRARIAIGSIMVESLITREQSSFDFAVLHLGETELTGGVRPAGVIPSAVEGPGRVGSALHEPASANAAAHPGPSTTLGTTSYEEIKNALLTAMQPGGIPDVIRLLDQHLGTSAVSIRSLFRDEQRRILNVLCNSTLEEAESAFRQLHERYDPLMRFHTRLGIPLPKVLQTAAEFDLNLQLRRLLEQEPLPVAEIESRLREALEERVTVDETTTLALTRAIERAAARFRTRPASIERLDEHHAIVVLVRSMKMPVDLRKPQNEYYAMKSSVRPAMTANPRWLELFDDLGEQLSISPDAGAAK